MSKTRFECVNRATGEVWFQGVSATRAKPCPVCEKPTSNREGYCVIDWVRGRVWCGHARDSFQGRFFNLSESEWSAPPKEVKTVRDDPEVNWEAEQLDLAAAMTPQLRRKHAKLIGVSESALIRLRAGFHESGAVSFPMRWADGKVGGIRLRCEDGFKFAIRGSKNLLFVPDNFNRFDHAVICEGPTDTAAGIDIGLNIVGRASALTCREELFKVCQNAKSVVIVRDADEVGLRGAEQVATDLYKKHIPVKIIRPLGHKDLRSWKAGGLTTELFKSVCANYSNWKPT